MTKFEMSKRPSQKVKPLPLCLVQRHLCCLDVKFGSDFCCSLDRLLPLFDRLLKF